MEPHNGLVLTITIPWSKFCTMIVYKLLLVRYIAFRPSATWLVVEDDRKDIFIQTFNPNVHFLM